MAIFPKATGDEVTAAEWNTVAAQADDALKPAGNLAGLADKPTARDNLDLVAVANTGDYDDLSNRPVIYHADGGFKVQDEDGFVVFEVSTAGIITAASFTSLTSTGALESDGIRVVTDATTASVVFQDEDGFIVQRFTSDGTGELPGAVFTRAGATVPVLESDETTVTDTADLPGLVVTVNAEAPALRIVDEYGFVAAEIDADGAGSGSFGGSSSGGDGEPVGGVATTYAQYEIDARDGINRAAAAAMAVQLDHESYRPVLELNHVILYGQSLANGAEGVPSLSLTAAYDNLMLGESVHSASGNTTGVTTWTAETSNAFYPLTEIGYGETILTAACNYWRFLDFQFRGITANAAQRLVASEAGIGGKTIAELSKGASPDYFNRLLECATLGETVAGADTYGIAAFLWMQGESDQTTNKATYLAALRALYADFLADVAVAIAAQDKMPAMFTYQTVARNTNYDGVDLGVQMAQLDMATTDDGVYMVGPIYNVPDSNNIHLPTNGYRWVGAQFGKVMHRVLTRGHRWKPLHPLRITRRAAEILVDLHVPYPPIASEAFWRSTTTGGENTATTHTDLGFSVVTSAGGTLEIDTVTLASGTQVLITLAAPPPAGTTVYVRYADGAHVGSGNIRDSDPALALDEYIYDPGTYPTQDVVDDIPALNGERYPLWNWLVAFHMAAEPEA